MAKKQQEKKSVVAKIMGRPTDYKSEFCQKVIALGKLGKSRAELALALDVDRATIADWEQKHKDFSSAMRQYADFAEAWWCQWAHENVDNKNCNAALYNINMQNRFGWNKKTEVSGSVTITHEQALKELE